MSIPSAPVPGKVPGNAPAGSAPLPHLSVTGLPGIPEISAGDDLGALIFDAIAASGHDLRDGDILVVTSKVVSKAEGRTITATREEAIAAETVRVVARRG